GHDEAQQRKDHEQHERKCGERRPPLRAVETVDARGQGSHAVPCRHAALDHSTALPLRANMPCGRRWMKKMMKMRTAILASTAPDQDSRILFTRPSMSAANTAPA